MIKKFTTVGVVALTLTGSLLAASSSAQAGHWRHHHWHHGPHWGVPLATGILGAIAVGAAASAAYPYGRCYFTRQAVTDDWGNFLGYQRVRVCG